VVLNAHPIPEVQKVFHMSFVWTSGRPSPPCRLVCQFHYILLLLAAVRVSVGVEVESPSVGARIVTVHSSDNALMRTEPPTTTQMRAPASSSSQQINHSGQVRAEMMKSGAMHIIHGKTASHRQEVSKTHAHSSTHGHSQTAPKSRKVVAAPKRSKVVAPKQELLRPTPSKNSKQIDLNELSSGKTTNKKRTDRSKVVASKREVHKPKRTPRSKHNGLNEPAGSSIAKETSKTVASGEEHLGPKQSVTPKQSDVNDLSEVSTTKPNVVGESTTTVLPEQELLGPKKSKSSKQSDLNEPLGDSMAKEPVDGESVHDGFQERSDEWRQHERGYTWKQEHDSRDSDDDDDWDDERLQQDVDAGDKDDDSEKSDEEGDGDGNGDGDGDGDESYEDGNLEPEVDVTGERDASAAPNSGPLKAITPHQPQAPPPENDVERLGEGIGAMAYERSPTGSRSINHEIRERLKFQDVAAVVILVSVFVMTVLLSCFSVYQIAEDPSPVAYYSEPKNYRQQRVICEDSDANSFLAAFNTQPEDVRFRIIGKNPEPGGFRRFLRTLHPHTMRPRGLAALLPVRQRRLLPVLFDVSLDLTPFITGSGRISEDNLSVLQNYLSSKNRLETLLLQKHVDWSHFQDVATNVRQQLRSLGFPGDVDVRFEAYDEVLIYQNHKWTNFVRNRVTQALVVISIVGSFFWVPYVWTRSKTTKVESRFQVNVDPARFWQLVSEGLSAAEGFQAT